MLGTPPRCRVGWVARPPCYPPPHEFLRCDSAIPKHRPFKEALRTNRAARNFYTPRLGSHRPSQSKSRAKLRNHGQPIIPYETEFAQDCNARVSACILCIDPGLPNFSVSRGPTAAVLRWRSSWWSSCQQVNVFPSQTRFGRDCVNRFSVPFPGVALRLE